MAVLIKDFDKPVSCEWVDDKNHLQRCLFLNGDDDCILHHCPDEWSWNEQYDACPLAEGKENVKGEWKEVYAETDYRNGWIEFSCECCEHQHGLESGEYGWHYGEEIPWKYCPLCGADMRGKGDD